jgi:ATP-dependent DNA helicase RecQ
VCLRGHLASKTRSAAVTDAELPEAHSPAQSLDPKRRVLREVFGYDAFRPGQEAAMDAVLDGRQVLCVMPTGSGKSLCFQVPALVLGGLTIVVSPLVALMQDQVAALQLAGVAADTINSSRSREQNVEVWRRVAAGEIRLLYLSPERLMTDRMLAALSRLPVRLIAVDEAHCISQWGPAFRPEYEMLSHLREVFADVPVIALTATADESTRADIVAKLFGGGAEEIVLGFDRPNIELTVTPKKGWKQQLAAFVEAHAGQSGIVYCLSRKRTEQAAELLAERGIKALAYHAGMSKEAREANQNAFITEPAVVMVATIAFGMGIDKSDVRYVFHVDLPASLESYYQEIGRAGRDGAPAEAHMLFAAGDIAMRRKFIDDEDSSEDRKRREHQRLAALIGYCEASSCRRRILLGYFGEASEPCGNCDVCSNPAPLVDRTDLARQILGVVARTGQRYGAGHIVDVLRGAESEKIVRSGHNRLEAYGSGAERKAKEWRWLIRQLIGSGYLVHDIAGYGGLSLSDEAQALLRGEGQFLCREEDAGSSRKRAAAASSDDLAPDEAALLANLKELRLSLARARRVPAYVIFSDRTLLDMTRRAPRTMSEFAEVSGVGASKLRDFGRLFLEAIAAHCDAA